MSASPEPGCVDTADSPHPTRCTNGSHRHDGSRCSFAAVTTGGHGTAEGFGDVVGSLAGQAGSKRMVALGPEITSESPSPAMSAALAMASR